MRSLKQLLEKTYRKVALKLVKGGLSGPTPVRPKQTPAEPGDPVTEHGGVGLNDDAPQLSPPETSNAGTALESYRSMSCCVDVSRSNLATLCRCAH